MSILVAIPHLTARARYLHNCLRGYNERGSTGVRVSIVNDAPSCGEGWQRCVDQTLANYPDIEYIHFSNDDIVVGQGWELPLIEAVDAGFVPASRIEPAGGHLGMFNADFPPMPPEGFPAPTCSGGYFYSDLPENQPTEDWVKIDHGGLPFCSVAQWHKIGPFPPIHFGSDQWFYHRARELGWETVARQGSVIYNYCSSLGRDFGDWRQIDMMDFDCVFALPDYEAGRLSPDTPHPLRGTAAGLELTRNWRRNSFPPPYHWETPE